jgi:hypothetical protein
VLGEIKSSVTDLQRLKEAGTDVEIMAQLLAAFDGTIPAPLHVCGGAARQAPPNAAVVLDQRVWAAMVTHIDRLRPHRA